MSRKLMHIEDTDAMARELLVGEIIRGLPTETGEKKRIKARLVVYFLDGELPDKITLETSKGRRVLIEIVAHFNNSGRQKDKLTQERVMIPVNPNVFLEGLRKGIIVRTRLGTDDRILIRKNLPRAEYRLRKKWRKLARKKQRKNR